MFSYNNNNFKTITLHFVTAIGSTDPSSLLK